MLLTLKKSIKPIKLNEFKIQFPFCLKKLKITQVQSSQINKYRLKGTKPTPNGKEAIASGREAQLALVYNQPTQASSIQINHILLCLSPQSNQFCKKNAYFHPLLNSSQNAQIKSLEEYQQLYEKAKADPQKFWAELAETQLDWFQKWDTVLDWQPPFAKWFDGGKINISYNCLDRHLTTWRRNKAALIWEGEPGDSRTFTYAQLHREVCQFANVLKQLGVQKGDVVGIYMPMIPEAAIAMLACARIGAPHSVVFGGFSAEALRDRLNDGKAKLVVTADGGWRKDAIVPLKEQVDKALANNSVPSVENVLVVKRTAQEIHMEAGRDHWWHDLQQGISADCPAAAMDSEDMLFILYTSGSTGKPKGVVHTTARLQLIHPHDSAMGIRPQRHRRIIGVPQT